MAAESNETPTPVKWVLVGACVFATIGIAVAQCNEKEPSEPVKPRPCSTAQR